MTTILVIALIIAIALFWRERKIRKFQVKDWSIAYADLWSEYQFTAHTLEEITGIDIL
jgi:hypothetical protein